MRNVFLFPLNVVFIMLIATFLSSFSLSYFYNEVAVSHYFFVFLVVVVYCFFYFALIKKSLGGVNYNYKLAPFWSYKFFLVFSILIFIVEFSLYGIPALSSGGREAVKNIPVLHVIAYSSSLVAVLFSSTYSSIKSKVITVFVVSLLGVLLLSRQLIVVSFLILAISYLSNKNTRINYLKVLIVFAFLIFSFAFVGDFRQELSGDYIEDYILIVGGANEYGKEIGSSLYWMWLYLTSPIYNFFVNLDSYNEFKSSCNLQVYYGSCSGDYITSVILPDTMAKFFDLERLKIDLQVKHLNVGTGFASAARILGMMGIFIQISFQIAFFYLGLKLMSPKVRSAFIVYFSSLSLLLVFDNLFIRGEFFFVFIIIFLSQFRLTAKNSYSHIKS